MPGGHVDGRDRAQLRCGAPGELASADRERVRHARHRAEDRPGGHRRAPVPEVALRPDAQGAGSGGEQQGGLAPPGPHAGAEGVDGVPVGQGHVACRAHGERGPGPGQERGRLGAVATADRLLVAVRQQVADFVPDVLGDAASEEHHAARLTVQEGLGHDVGQGVGGGEQHCPALVGEGSGREGVGRDLTGGEVAAGEVDGLAVVRARLVDLGGGVVAVLAGEDVADVEPLPGELVQGAGSDGVLVAEDDDVLGAEGVQRGERGSGHDVAVGEQDGTVHEPGEVGPRERVDVAPPVGQDDGPGSFGEGVQRRQGGGLEAVGAAEAGPGGVRHETGCGLRRAGGGPEEEDQSGRRGDGAGVTGERNGHGSPSRGVHGTRTGPGLPG